MESQIPQTDSQSNADDDIAELVGLCLLSTTKYFNSVMTEGASREEDFPKEKLPSNLYPEQFSRSLDVIPLALSKWINMPGNSEDAVNKFIQIIAISMAMGAKDSFVGYRMKLDFGFYDNSVEKMAVKALSDSSLIRGFGIPFKLVKSSFSDYERPKANDPKQDMLLQLALRLFLYTTARWYGASQDQAQRIYDQHLKVSWAHVMCGSWNKAIELLDRGNRR